MREHLIFLPRKNVFESMERNMIKQVKMLFIVANIYMENDMDMESRIKTVKKSMKENG